MLLGSSLHQRLGFCSPAAREHRKVVPTRLAASSGTSSSYNSSNNSSSSNGRNPRFDAASVNSSTSGAFGNGAPGSGARGAEPASPRTMTPAEISSRMVQLNELIAEAGKIVIASGPKGFFRALQATNAVITLAQEYSASGAKDPPQVVLRKLFEKLGATYIKLGQFIASSPSIFPDEYVMEFQKCLDQADPIPYSVVKGIIEKVCVWWGADAGCCMPLCMHAWLSCAW